MVLLSWLGGYCWKRWRAKSSAWTHTLNCPKTNKQSNKQNVGQFFFFYLRSSQDDFLSIWWTSAVNLPARYHSSLRRCLSPLCLCQSVLSTQTQPLSTTPDKHKCLFFVLLFSLAAPFSSLQDDFLSTADICHCLPLFAPYCLSYILFLSVLLLFCTSVCRSLSFFVSLLPLRLSSLEHLPAHLSDMSAMYFGLLLFISLSLAVWQHSSLL